MIFTKIASNLTPIANALSPQQRVAVIGHAGVALWLTGLSGSGKSTLAYALEKKLYEQGCLTFILDGDNVRTGLCRDLDFSEESRKENIRRCGEVTKLFVDAGLIVMAAFISPFMVDRDQVRSIFSKNEFFEIYCNCSLKICESRDVKGLYKKARAGEIPDFTGVDAEYQPPTNPDLIIDSEIFDVNDSVSLILNFLQRQNII